MFVGGNFGLQKEEFVKDWKLAQGGTERNP